MIQRELLSILLEHFAKYIPVETRRASMKQTQSSQTAGYAELQERLLSIDENKAFADIDTYVLSISEKYVSERMRNSKKFILFVEYGNIQVPDHVIDFNDISLSISVAAKLDTGNCDMLQEALKMQQSAEMLSVIVDELKEVHCLQQWEVIGSKSFQPLDPSLFFGCGGWSASFTLRKAVL